MCDRVFKVGGLLHLTPQRPYSRSGASGNRYLGTYLEASVLKLLLAFRFYGGGTVFDIFPVPFILLGYWSQGLFHRKYSNSIH